MKTPATLYLPLVLAAGWPALAVNDWSVPCTQGRCSWNLPADSGASGTVHIWGSPNAISDITIATGWRITSCDPSAMTQDIQLVCEGDNPDCDHLFQGGAVHTIVRLPDNCGPMPFARVAQHRVLQPRSSSGDEPQVHGLTLDTNFAATTESQNGNVHFALQGMNTNGNPSTAVPVPRGHRRARGRHSSRGEFSRRNFITDGLNALENANTFNQTLSQTTAPVTFSGSSNLFNTTIQCPVNGALSVTASASLDAGANVNATVSLGAVAAGTLVPPEMTEFGLYFGLGGTIDANLSITANVTGKVSSGSIPLFQIGIPGLSIPGILDIGPEFKVTSEIDAQLKLTDIQASVDLKYDLNDISFVFPPQQGSSQAGTFKPGTTKVSISTNPDIGVTLEATGHLIPQVDVGLSALGGAASTTVFLNLDASVDFTIGTTTTSGAQACANADTALNVGVGAQASFFNLFDASVTDSLFKTTFPLLQNKCFGGSNTTASSPASATPAPTGTPAPPTNVGMRRHDARWPHHAVRGGSFLPLDSRGVTLVCPFIPSKAKVVINESVP